MSGSAYSSKGHSGEVNAVAVTVDGRRVVSVCSDKTLRVWVFTGSGGFVLVSERVTAGVRRPAGGQSRLIVHLIPSKSLNPASPLSSIVQAIS